MKRVAVTGSNGFIGKHLVPKLQQKGFEVMEISRTKGIDITNWAMLEKLPSCEAIIHLAAKTFVPDSFINPEEFYRVNTQSTIHALELARKWDAKMVYMSSYFYGPPQYIPVDEKHPLQPHNPYAQSKLHSEQLCEAYFRDFGVSAIAFRLFNIYGPGQTGSFLIPEILEKIKTGRLELKDPRPKRDYIHVFDVVQALEAGLRYESTGFQVFNLGSGKSYSVEEVVEKIRKLSPVSFDVEYSHEYRKGEVLDSVANIDKITNMLPWLPKVSLEAGLKTLLIEKNIDG